MTTAKRLHYSHEDYRRLLEESTLELEYCDGIIYAMAGGTLAHASAPRSPRSSSRSTSSTQA